MFFVAVFIIGYSIYQDYGVHWDEYNNQTFGRRWYRYVKDVFKDGPILENIQTNSEPSNLYKEYSKSRHWIKERHDRTHGAIFEVLSKYIDNNFFKLDSDKRNILLRRHLFTFCIYFLGLVFFYLLSSQLFKNRGMGLLGCIFYLLMPRIFAHSFYNTTDISFLTVYVIGSYTFFLYLRKRSLLRLIFHALACAALVGIRVVGVFLPLLTVMFLVLDILINVLKKKMPTRMIVDIFLFSVLTAAFTVILWPFLWKDPLHNFYMALTVSKYSTEKKPDVAWFYNLKYMFLTIPPVFTFLFLSGSAVFLKDLFTGIRSIYEKQKFFLVSACLFAGPLILPMLIKTRLYNGWRHHYFIYPLFVIFILKGLEGLSAFLKRTIPVIKGKSWNKIIAVLLLICFAHIALFMVNYHPHQYIYANIFSGEDKEAVKEFGGLDYWGVTYKTLLEYIAENDDDPLIIVYADTFPAIINFKILPDEDKARIKMQKSLRGAEYMVTDFHDSKYVQEDGTVVFGEEIFSVKYGEVKYGAVYKIDFQVTEN